MKIFELVNWGNLYLSKLNIENAGYDARELMLMCLNTDINGFFLVKQDIPSEDIVAEYKTLIERRGTHFPLQYIIGKTGFMGFEFIVEPGVLIPRQDTEILCEAALNRIKAIHDNNGQTVRLLDMCTGSGCIGISLELISRSKGIEVSVDLVDISKDALKIASKNAAQLGSKARIVESDLFANVTDTELDIIVSNPPYIDAYEMETLMPEVKEYEPRLALYGEEDGLFFYRNITREAAKRLKTGGYLMYEIGCNQGKEVSDIMKDAGFSGVTVIKDYAGLDRVVMGKLDGL